MSQKAGTRGTYRVGLSFSALSFAVMAVLGVGSSILIARLFGVRVVGEFALASAPAGALWFLSSVKEQTALIKRLTALEPRDPQVTGLWAAVFTFSMALTIVAALLAGGAAYLLFNGPIDQPDLFAPAVACLFGYVFIINIGWNLDGIFAAFVAGRELFWVRLHQSVALVVWYIAAGLIRPDVWGLIVATYASAGTAIVHRLILVPRYMRLRVPRAEVREGFRILPEIIVFGIKMTPGTIAQGLSNQSSTWLLGILSTVSAVGAFNRAQVLTMRFQDLTTKITEMLFPTLVARRGAGDGHGFDRALIDTLRYSTLIMLMIASVGGGGAFAIMDLFGPGFAPAAPAFAILVLLPALTTMSVIQAYALYAVDRPGLASFIQIGRLVVTVTVGYVLVKSIGLVGPAIGLVAGAAFDVVVKAVFVRPYLTGSLFKLWTPRQMIAAVVAYGSGFFAARDVHTFLPDLVALPLVLGAGVLAFTLTLVLMGGLGERDWTRLEPITSTVVGRMQRRRATVKLQEER